MRWRGLALSRGTVPPIAQRPLRRSTAYRGRNLNRRSSCPDHRRLRSFPLPVGSEFSHYRRPGVAPVPTPQSSSSPVAQSAASGRWPEVSPSPGGSGLPRALRPEVSPCRVAPRPLKPVDLRCPVAGWLRVSPGRRPEVSRCRVAPDLPEPEARGFPLPGGSESPQAGGLRCPVAGWLRVSPGRRPEVSRCRVARGCPLAGWRRVSSVPVAPGRPWAREPKNFPVAGWLRKSSYQWREALPLPGGSGVSPFASGLGFPLRRLPFPVVKKFLRLFVRGAQEVCASNFKILWPSTSHPQLTPGCPPRQAFCPPSTPQRGPQAGRAGLHPRVGYRPANLSSGSRASLT